MTTSTQLYNGIIIYSKSGAQDLEVEYVIGYLNQNGAGGFYIHEAKLVN